MNIDFIQKDGSAIWKGYRMYLETERLIIRSIKPEDEAAFIEIASDGSLDEDIFGGWPGEYEVFIHDWILEAMALDGEDNPEKDYLAYAIVEKTSGVVIGSVGCSYYEDSGEIGPVYFIGTPYRGKYFSAEAMEAYGRYFFERYKRSKLSAVIRTENIASCKVAEQAGFRLMETKMYQDIFDTHPKQYNFYEMKAPVKG